MKLVGILFALIGLYFTVPTIIQTQFQGVPFEEVILPLQEQPKSWALDSINSEEGAPLLDSEITINSTGKGVTVYVVDTGVVSTSDNSTLNSYYNFTDEHDRTVEKECHNHATMMNSIIAGEENGVAKEVTLVNLKALTCDKEDFDGENVLESLQWVINNHNNGPAVINMSLSFKGNTAAEEINTLIDQLAEKNIPVVTSAGNQSVDACTVSPASSPTSITVGAYEYIARQVFLTDASNYGECVNIYAPGEKVSAVNAENKNMLVSGTSPAAAYVSGVIALYLGNNPNATVEDVKNWLYSNAQQTPIFVRNAEGFMGSILRISEGY